MKTFIRITVVTYYVARLVVCSYWNENTQEQFQIGLCVESGVEIVQILWKTLSMNISKE